MSERILSGIRSATWRATKPPQECPGARVRHLLAHRSRADRGRIAAPPGWPCRAPPGAAPVAATAPRAGRCAKLGHRRRADQGSARPVAVIITYHSATPDFLRFWGVFV